MEKKWLNLVSGGLDRFKWTSNDNARCRCPICGDSKKSKAKARGNFYIFENKINFKCFNCGASMSLGNFIKQVFPGRHAEYLKDVLKETGRIGPLMHIEGFSNPTTKIHEKPSEIENMRDMGGTRISEVHNTHEALLYLRSRQIPERTFSRIYFARNFADFIRKNTPKKADSSYDKLPKDQRVIFPLLDFDGSIIGFQGRSLDPKSNLRYITIKFFTECSRLYGRETLNIAARVFVVEGPIDSLFLPNCLALCGGDVTRDLDFLDKENTTIALDNEPRNADTIKRTETAIDHGFGVVVWKKTSPKLKDINAMILGGYTQESLLSMIEENTFYGLRAKIELGKWKRT